jgi:hypothetical protein
MIIKSLLIFALLSLKTATGTYALTPTNGDMSQATVTASPVSGQAGDMRQKRFVAVVASWTGSPVGSAQLYCSADQNNFIPLGTPLAVSGTGPVGWDIVDSGCHWLAVIYTKTSGSGTLTVSESSKGQ